MARISGAVRSSDVNELRPDVSSQLALLDAKRYPLMAMLVNAGRDPITGNGVPTKKKVVTNHKFEWYEDSYSEYTDAINHGAGYAASANSMVVDNGAYFNPNDVIVIPRTGERILVTGVSSNTLTVTRSIGDTSAASINDNDDVMILGSAYGQATDLQLANTKQTVNKYNYCQLFKTPFEVSGTHMAEENYAEDTIIRLRKKKAVEHMQAIERAFLFGERGTSSDTDSKTNYLTGGILNFIETNIQDESDSTLTEDEFENFLEQKVFAHGSTEKVLLASGRVISDINKFARDNIQTKPGSRQTYGLSVREYVSPHGTLSIIKEPYFDKVNTYKGYAVALDLEGETQGETLGYRHLPGRDTRLYTNTQANDMDSRKDYFLTEAGLKFGQEKRHALLKGVSTS